MAERHEDAASGVDALKQDSWDDADQLNRLAWLMAAEMPEPAKDLEAARLICERANELSNSEDPSILDTMARVEYECGELEKAIEWQQKAVSLSPARSLKTTLEGFEAELELKQANAKADASEATADEGSEATADEPAAGEEAAEGQ